MGNVLGDKNELQKVWSIFLTTRRFWLATQEWYAGYSEKEDN